MTSYKPGRTIVYVVCGLLAVEVAGQCILSLGECLEAFVLGHGVDDPSEDFSSPLAIVTALALAVGGLGQIGSLLLCAAAFCFWFFRAAKNAEHFAQGHFVELGAGWAIGGFFVPFLNLVRPYQMARQIERLSGSNGESAIIGFWWGAFTLNNILGNIEFRVTDIDVLAVLSVLSTVTTIAGAALCARMMFYVEDLQAQKATSPHDLAEVFA